MSMATQEERPLASSGLPFAHLLYERPAGASELSVQCEQEFRPFAFQYLQAIENPRDLPFSLEEVRFDADSQTNQIPGGITMGFTITLTYSDGLADDCDPDPL